MDHKLALAIGWQRARARTTAAGRGPLDVERLVAAAKGRARGRVVELDPKTLEVKIKAMRSRARTS